MPAHPTTMRITIDIPKGVDPCKVAEYVTDALNSWGGQFHPYDGLFGGVRVRSIKAGSDHYAFSNRD